MNKTLILAGVIVAGLSAASLAQTSGGATTAPGATPGGGAPTAPGTTATPGVAPGTSPAVGTSTTTPSTDTQNAQQPGVGVNSGASNNAGVTPPPRR